MARRRRWAAEDAAEFHDLDQRRARRTPAIRTVPWRKVYPWLLFAGLALIVIAF